jgi:hypothetical protein
MYLLPRPLIGENPLWDTCQKESHEIMCLIEFGALPKDVEEGEERAANFIEEWGFEPYTDLDELFIWFWRHYISQEYYKL